VGVLVLSQYVEKRYTTQLITSDAGAVGYLLKDRVAQVGEFLDALDRVGAGNAAFDPEVVRQLLSRTTHTDPLSRLTPREQDVLGQMAQGYTNDTIAAKLYVSRSAVEKHVNSIFDKLDLPRSTGYSRRILAVLRYLGS
jgi:DNA-binding NarL/FixJ family response regulator